jgi:YD repeat-containing protein
LWTCTIGPDEIKVIEETNPIGTLEWKAPIQTSWREGAGAQPLTSGKTLTYLNLFEKPNHIERLETDGTIVSKHQYEYDGLGRTVTEIDARDAITRFVYDEFDRLVANILPGGATVNRTYAEHSPEDLQIEISVDGRVLGLQAFDGLDRMKESVTGGRPQFYTYEPGHSQPATVTNARGQLIQYAYELQLSDEPKRRSLPGKTPAEYVHDGKNARLVSCKEDGLELQRAYFSTGNLKSEKRIQDSQSYDMYFDYSRLGLLLDYTDVLGQTQSYNYDAASRLKNTQLGTTSSQFTYDSLGQTRTISTQDSASEQSVTISLEYDGLGREITRSFDLNGVEQQLTQVYNAVDALVSRTLKEGPNPLRAETYGYDSRGRLVLYTSEGDQSPVDPYGKVIKKQVFRFDAIDNLTRVTTTYENLDGTSGTNVADYFYGGVDPAQLTKVTNTPTGFGYPAEIVLEYDDDGHMVRDEEGRTLEYDELGRLTHVSGLAGETPTDYHYDPQDTLSWTEGEHGQDQRFYQDDNLVNQLQGSKNSTFMRGAGVVLAERQEGDGPKF